MYDVQLRGAMALIRGSIAEMQTGEGKTLAAVPAIAWLARAGLGVHVMTVNDYLARRDAAWMGGIYRFLGLSVAHVQQGMDPAQRKAAYRSDITYATANEIGFPFLRDRMALDRDNQVHRPFAVAVIDEADSILIDEARVPIVIARGATDDGGLAHAANQVARGLQQGEHYTIDVGAHNASERLSALLPEIPHEVLNARNDEREAATVACAGERGAVTISTNMAGGGTDIRLGAGVADLGGLCVIGANKHESRSIDNQLKVECLVINPLRTSNERVPVQTA